MITLFAGLSFAGALLWLGWSAKQALILAGVRDEQERLRADVRGTLHQLQALAHRSEHTDRQMHELQVDVHLTGVQKALPAAGAYRTPGTQKPECEHLWVQHGSTGTSQCSLCRQVYIEACGCNSCMPVEGKRMLHIAREVFVTKRADVRYVEPDPDYDYESPEQLNTRLKKMRSE